MRRTRPLVLAMVAVVAAVSFTLAPAAARPVAAASSDLTLVTAARYDVQPEQHRVRISVDISAVNHLTDTAIRRYYFDRFFLQVLPGTSGYKVTASGSTPSVRVSASTSRYRILQIMFGKRLYSLQSTKLHLTFDLPDPGGSATRQIRISDALVSLPVWAFGTPSTPGSSVTVTFPAGYTLDPDVGDLNDPSTAADGSLVLTSGHIGDPFAFFAYLQADRPGAYAETALAAAVGQRTVRLAIRAWADDAAWAKRVGGLFVKGLPRLGSLIGLEYPRTDRLIVQESVSRSLQGYAGLFDPTTGKIEVAYYASPFVVLHEAAHAWFNGTLLADRWANEAFASYYAEQAAAALKMSVTPPELTDTLRTSRIPLNAWGAVGREDAATEDYAYAATLAFARLVAKRAGTDGLAKVWEAAATHESPYPPTPAGNDSTPSSSDGSGTSGGAGSPPSNAGAVDWRGLLDLLEAKTGRSFEDLWREWVIRPQDAPLLDARASARSDYAETVRAAGDWALPARIRSAMAAWQFDAAQAMLADARDVLARRTAVESAATAAGLRPPTTLEQLFESGQGPGIALGEADAELAAIKTIDSAAASRLSAPDPVEQLGMWGTTPDSDLAAASAAFASGDLSAAVTRAEAARGVWTTALDVGRGRVLSGVAIGIAIAIGLALLMVGVRRLRRSLTRRWARATAGRGAQAHQARPDGDGRSATAGRPVPAGHPSSGPSSGAEALDSYATLAPRSPEGRIEGDTHAEGSIFPTERGDRR